MKMKIADIFVGGRIREEMGNIKEMAQDLLDNGQITAITVRPVSEFDKAEVEEGYAGQPYALVAGGRRLAAAMMIGWKEIEAFVREDVVEELQHRVLELHENIKRKQMSMEEEVKAKAEILRLRQAQDPTITQAEVAREIGDTPGNFSRAVTAAKAIEENPNLAKAGSIKGVLRVSRLESEMKARMARSEDDRNLVTKMNLQDRVVTADMRDWLRQRRDHSANLTVVDYPYGMNYWTAGHKEAAESLRNKRQAGISVFDDSPEYAMDLVVDTLPEIVRTTRESGWMVFFANYDFEKFLRATLSDLCSVHYDYRSDDPKCCVASDNRTCKFLVPAPMPWVWYRPNSQNNPRYPDLHAKNMFEYVLVVNRGAGRLNMPSGKSNVPNVLVHDAYYGSDRIHGNQKPLELYRDIIERCTDLGDVVVDPAYGSGASLAAAGSIGRYFYGSELNADLRGSAIGLVSKHLGAMPGLDEVGSERRAELLALKAVETELLATVEEVEDTQAIQMKQYFAKRDELHEADKEARKESKAKKEAAARAAAEAKAREEEEAFDDYEFDEDEDESFELVEE